MRWQLSSSSDPAALAVVDGVGFGVGPHYSRRTPGSKTFTGVGQEVVLLSDCGRAVWAVVRQRTPARRGTGGSRGRTGAADEAPRYVWRNMLFRNLGAGLSSDLIRAATQETYWHWRRRYGEMPSEPLRTEVKVSAVRSSNPGYCYRCAGWVPGPTKRGIRFLFAPRQEACPETRELCARQCAPGRCLSRDERRGDAQTPWAGYPRPSA